MSALVVIILAGVLMSCGVPGGPVPPDFVGVAPTVAKQKQQHALEAAREAAKSSEVDQSLESHDLDLPPTHPVGTR